MWVFQELAFFNYRYQYCARSIFDVTSHSTCPSSSNSTLVCCHAYIMTCGNILPICHLWSTNSHPSEYTVLADDEWEYWVFILWNVLFPLCSHYAVVNYTESRNHVQVKALQMSSSQLPVTAFNASTILIYTASTPHPPPTHTTVICSVQLWLMVLWQLECGVTITSYTYPYMHPLIIRAYPESFP